MVKKRVIALLCAVATFLAGGLYPLAVYAEQSTGSPVTTAAETEAESNSQNAKERLEKKKAELQVRLDEAQKNRIKTRCTAAQAVIKTRSENLGSRAPGRTQAYENLLSRLNNLVDKAKAKGIDTTTLESQVAELQVKVNTHSSDLAAYKQALSDLQEIDCTADQEAFQAGLETARGLLKSLAADVLAIREYVTGTIKPTLQSIRAQLEQESSAPTSNDSTNAAN